jgi:hypothetical protein
VISALKFSAKPARSKKIGGPSLQNFPHGASVGFFQTGALLFLRRSGEVGSGSPKDHAPTKKYDPERRFSETIVQTR